jgi:hypothetical protein
MINGNEAANVAIGALVERSVRVGRTLNRDVLVRGPENSSLEEDTAPAVAESSNES